MKSIMVSTLCFIPIEEETAFLESETVQIMISTLFFQNSSISLQFSSFSNGSAKESEPSVKVPAFHMQKPPNNDLHAEPDPILANFETSVIEF